MNIKKISVGELETNCYIAENGGEYAVIDPGGEAEKILGVLDGAVPAAILLTHGHFDHLGAAAELRAKTGARIYIHKGDAPMTSDSQKSLAFMTGAQPAPFEADVLLKGGEELALGGSVLKVMHTPGHSLGGVCYISGNIVFCGDLIFKGCIGRYDFGSYADEAASICRLLAELSDNAVLYPGHGDETSVGYEKRTNPYVREVLKLD